MDQISRYVASKRTQRDLEGTLDTGVPLDGSLAEGIYQALGNVARSNRGAGLALNV